MAAQVKLNKIVRVVNITLFILAFVFFTYDNTVVWPLQTSVRILTYSYLYDAAVICAVLSAFSRFASNYFCKKELATLILKIIIIFVVVAYDTLSPSNAATICTTILLAISSDCQMEDKICKTVIYIATAFIIVLFIISMLGILPIDSSHVFGFGYRTYYACFLLCVMLVYAIYKDGWFTWIEELGLICLIFFSGFVVKGRTAFVCLVLLFIGISYRHYRKNRGIPFQEKESYGYVIPFIFMVLYIPAIIISIMIKHLNLRKKCVLGVMKYSFLICAALIYILTLTYRLSPVAWNSVLGQSTIVSRLFQNNIGFEQFPLNLLGNKVNQSAPSGFLTSATLYFVLDSSYVVILIENGVLIFFVIMGLMTWLQIRLYKARRYFAMFVLAIFAIDCIMESQLALLPFNTFILLAFCQLSPKAGMENCERLKFGDKQKKRKLLVRLVCVVTAILLLFTWHVASSPITGWAGQTPDYDATIVIPVDFLEGDNGARLTRAKYYLNFRKDAGCIVFRDTDKEWLETQGIDEGRIFVGQAVDIDSMLLEGQRLIKDHSLPTRLTICTYKPQQTRIQRHAETLHIPVNSLTLKASPGETIGMVITETWRLLWGK